jgi:hypothetical protein
MAIPTNLDRESGGDILIQPLLHQLLRQIFRVAFGNTIRIAIEIVHPIRLSEFLEG